MNNEEKAIPKQVIIAGMPKAHGKCPTCKRIFWSKNEVGEFCNMCGQKLEPRK